MASMNFDNAKIIKLTEERADELSSSSTIREQKNFDLDESLIDSRKNRYDRRVLVGNWYERRNDYEPPLFKWSTGYDDTYTCKKNNALKDDRRSAEDNKIRAEGGLGAEFLLRHQGPAYYDNYATTNDLLYRVVPLGLCGPRRRKYSMRKGVWMPEKDLTKNFGNVTNYGFSDDIFDCDNFAKFIASRSSGLKKSSTPIKRFSKPKGNFNEPQLAHLDIDVNKPFCRRYDFSIGEESMKKFKQR